MENITHLNIEVTRHCNQRCFYCFNESGADLDHTPYAPTQWLKLLAQLRAQGLKSVHLTGGEPFSWWGTVELLRGAQRLELFTSILSNGCRIPKLVSEDPEPFERLRVAQISLDAMTPAVHDARRGVQGAWIAAVRAIEALHALRVPLEISAVISESNLDEIPHLAKYCADLGAKLLIRPLLPLGRARTLISTDNWQAAMQKALDDVAVTWPRVLTSDAFRYLPEAQDTKSAARRDVATMHCEGSLRADTAPRLGPPRSYFQEILRAA